MKFMDSVKPASNEVHVADICTCVLHPASETHRQLTTDEQLVAADEHDVPHAYCLCAITWPNEADGLCVWLDELMVEDGLRGQGVGQKLIAAVRTAYHSAARFCLEVTDENPRTAALYRSLGFESLEYRQMVIDRKN